MKLLTRFGVLAGAAAALTGYARYARSWMLTWGATPERYPAGCPGTT